MYPFSTFLQRLGTSRQKAVASRVLYPGLTLSVIPIRVDQATGFVDFKLQE